MLLLRYEFNVLLGEEGVKHLLQQLGLSSLEELLKINQMVKLSSAQFQMSLNLCFICKLFKAQQKLLPLFVVVVVVVGTVWDRVRVRVRVRS